jgi:hypothetical protein
VLCGLCPNRRVLAHLSLWPEGIAGTDAPGPVVVPTAVGRRRWRPAVESAPLVDRAAAGEPIRWRCKRGHPWTFTHEQLAGAYLAAMAAGRREIVAGVDL